MIDVMCKILLLDLPLSDKDAILQPKWDEAYRVADWRNYIPIELQRMWDKLSIESRIITFYLAETMAHEFENWD